MSSPSSAERPAGTAARHGVAVLGSTGSIGRQTLEVLVGLRDRFEVVALAAGRNAALLAEQSAAWQPRAAALVEGDDAAVDLPSGTERLRGEEALVQLGTRDDVDVVIVGAGGIVSLRPVLAALDAGKVVATANKETLVAGGHLVMPLARPPASRAGGSRPRGR